MASVHGPRWANAFAARGHDVHVLTPRPDPGTLARQYPLPGPIRTPAAARARVTVASDHLRAPGWARRMHADVYHLHSFLPSPMGYWSYRWPAPLVVSAWGSDAAWYGPGPMPRRRAAVLRWLFARATAVTLTSEHQRTHVAPFLPLGKEPVVIPWGVDTEQFTCGPSPVAERPPVILFPKGFRPHYAPEVLVRALSAVRRAVPNVRCVMLGDGALRPAMHRLAADCGVSDLLEFPGHVSPAQVARYWQQAAVGVVCSRWESYGVACLEGQACGVPVVISDIPGLRETGGADSGTVAVAPEDPDALAAAVVRLLNDPAERARLGAQGRTHVVREYQWETTVDTMEALYEHVAADAPPRT